MPKTSHQCIKGLDLYMHDLEIGTTQSKFSSSGTATLLEQIQIVLSLFFSQNILKKLGEYASISISEMNDCFTIRRNGRIS